MVLGNYRESTATKTPWERGLVSSLTAVLVEQQCVFAQYYKRLAISSSPNV